MVLPSPELVVALLLDYWRGGGPEDRSARNVCRQLAHRVRSRLPANVAQSIPGDASMYAAEIIRAVTELVRSDKQARALAESLSPSEQAATAQQVSVSGEHHLVFIAGRDIRGLDVQVSSESREETVTRATGEISKEQDKHLAHLRQLRQILATRFDQGELRTLCFDLGIDYDDLPGEGKANKARELVACLDNRGRISELLRAGEQLRPDISWSDILSLSTSMDEKAVPEIGHQQIDAILRFLPIFEGPGYKPGKWRRPEDQSPYFSYSPDVIEFLETLYQQNVLVPFDWTSWNEEARRYQLEPDALKTADLLTLRKLLTAHVRADRFVEGYLAGVLESGHIAAILCRLKQIRDQMLSED